MHRAKPVLYVQPSTRGHARHGKAQSRPCTPQIWDTRYKTGIRTTDTKQGSGQDTKQGSGYKIQNTDQGTRYKTGIRIQDTKHASGYKIQNRDQDKIHNKDQDANKIQNRVQDFKIQNRDQDTRYKTGIPPHHPIPPQQSVRQGKAR